MDLVPDPVALDGAAIAARAAGTAGAGFLFVASGVALRARRYWLGEIVANFRWQLGAGGLVAAALLTLGGWWIAAGATALLAAAHLAPAWRLSLPSAAPAVEGPELSVAVANVHANNRNLVAFTTWVAEETPDVLGVLEVSRFWCEALDALADLYPHRIVCPPGTPFGIALLSRHPIDRSELRRVRWRGLPWIEARIVVGGAPVQVLLVHPERPGSPWRIDSRNAYLREVVARTEWEERAIVMGDLNSTMYSPAFRDLVRDGELRDTRAGFGRLPTWRSDRLLHGLWLDLDHIFVRGEVQVLARGRGRSTGSDHLPATARLRVGVPGAAG